MPAFTVLFHAREPGRVGDVVPLGEESVSLAFGGAEPSASARMTRSGALLQTTGAPLRIAGTAARDRVVSSEEMRSGVVVEVDGTSALLLHLVRQSQPGLPRYGLVGESLALDEVREEIGRAASLPVPVLLRGESGTGKELVARAIAQHGSRAGRPFVAVNLAGVPASIAASELFGHAAGAFTGAAAAHAGYFAQADRGTLFLDEVGAAPLDVQAMLLRALETREIQPLGSSRSRPVDARIIAATDEDLELAMRQGRFRAALYHRLASYEIVLPPLRARRDDIGRLLFHFLRQELAALGAEQRLRDMGPGRWLSAETVGTLARADWPGNVRELANAARRLAMGALRSGSSPEGMFQCGEPQALDGGAMAVQPGLARRRPSSIAGEELLGVLRSSRWRMAEAARRLGISRTTLYALVDASDRIRKAKDLSEEELRRAIQTTGGRLDDMAELLEVSARGIQLRLRDLGVRR